MPGIVRMLDPYTYRCPAGHPDPCPVCTGAPHLEEILEYEGPHTVAAVILETVTGTNGIIPPPDGYLQAIREVCDRHGILLILDEVMAGFGRTGRWFACEHWDVVPDILSVAKGINSGYVPLGAMIARGEIVDQVRDRFFPGGLTYAGHPLACASAIASIEAFQEEGVVENAAAMGEYFGERSAALAERHPSIGDVRGLGCFWGVELVKNRDTKEMLVPFNASGEAAAPVARSPRRRSSSGLYLMTHWNVVMVVPPLTITREEAEAGIAILDDVARDRGRVRRAEARPRARPRSGEERARSRRRSRQRIPEDACGRRTVTTSSRSPSASRCASSRWSYERYESSPRTSSVGTRDVGERRRAGAISRTPSRHRPARSGSATRRRRPRGARGARLDEVARRPWSWLSS